MEEKKEIIDPFSIKSYDTYMSELYKVIKEMMYDSELVFFGIFLSELNKKFTARIDTACVSKHPNSNTIELLISPFFWDTLSLKEKMFILSHEIMHVVECCWDMEKEFELDNHYLFNVAADLSINTSLAPIKSLEVPKGVLLPSCFPDIQMKDKESSLYYYNLLKNNMKNLPKGTKVLFKYGNEDGGEGVPIEDLFNGKEDIHPFWKELTEGMSDIEKEAFKRSLVSQTTEIAQEASKNYGANIKDILNKLPKITKILPVTNWKTIFKRFIGSTISLSKKITKHKPNKRYENLPGKKDLYKTCGVVLTDSSGSISDDNLMRANAELYNIWKAGAQIDFGCWDDGVGEIKTYEGSLQFNRTKCGGTNIEPTFNFINQNYKKKQWQFSIIITDGYFSIPNNKPKIPTIVLITPEGTLDTLKNKNLKQIQIQE